LVVGKKVKNLNKDICVSKVNFEEMTGTFPSEKEPGVRLCLDVVPE